MYGYDLLNKIPNLTEDRRYASIDGRIIADDRSDRLAVLMPSWPVVELPADVATISPDEWVASHLVWSEEAGRWVHSPEMAAAIAEATR